MSKLAIDEVTLRCISGTTTRNFHQVTLGKLTLFFSYETVVGFSTPKTGLCVSENIWGTTTGKHLNIISDKTQRIPREEFLNLLNNIVLEIDILGGNENE